jgi:hypothetical protein
MTRKWFSILALIVAASLVVSESSCAYNQHLTSIQVTPASVTFLSPTTNITFQLKAYGTYIHPPETKDITDKVTWQEDSPDLVTVTPTGIISNAGTGRCGVTGVHATDFTDSGNMNGNVVVGNATATVVDTGVPLCPQH